MISNSPAEGGIPLEACLTVQRYDDFTLPPSPTNTTATLNFQLIDTIHGVTIPLLNTQAVFNVTIESTDGGTPPYPVAISEATNFSLVPLEQFTRLTASMM